MQAVWASLPEIKSCRRQHIPSPMDRRRDHRSRVSGFQLLQPFLEHFTAGNDLALARDQRPQLVPSRSLTEIILRLLPWNPGDPTGYADLAF